jgi:hypothetical protein
MVDANANAPVPIPNPPRPSGKASIDEALNQPTVLKAGEAMLIISLVLIFLVCCTVCLHLYLRRRKRQRGGGVKKDKKKKKGKGEAQPEIATQEKNDHVAELVGTPMCEIGVSEPRHEMEDVEVDERHLQLESESGSERSSCHKTEVSDSESGSEVDIEAGISWYDDSDERVEPNDRALAMYWARGM